MATVSSTFTPSFMILRSPRERTQQNGGWHLLEIYFDFCIRIVQSGVPAILRIVCRFTEEEYAVHRITTEHQN